MANDSMAEKPGRHEHVAEELAGWLVGEEGGLQRVILLVDLFSDEALEDLRRLAAFLEYTDAGARLAAALLYRTRGEPSPWVVEEVLRAASRAHDPTRADILVALAPRLSPVWIDAFIDAAGGIGDPELRHRTLEPLVDLRNLRLHPIAPPDAEPEPMEWPPLPPPAAADVRLVEIVLGLGAHERERLLREVSERAQHDAHPPTAAEPPPYPASDAGEPEAAPVGGADYDVPPPPPPPPPERGRIFDPYTGERLPTAASPPPPAPRPIGLPSLGNPLRTVGNALRNVGAAVRDVLGGLAASSGPVVIRNGTDVEEPKRTTPVVNTGLATREKPGEALEPDLPLTAGREHLFWLEIGEPVADSIETTPVGLAPELARMKAALTVVLFDAPGSEVVVRGVDRGRLRLNPDGSALVLEQPTKDPPKGANRDLLARRLLFPIKTPAGTANLRFRCNIYHEGVLVQSRLVSCAVRSQPARREGALRSTLDYVLARTLDPAKLAAAGPHELSIMTNEVDGSHAFYFAAGKDTDWAESVAFDGQELQSLLRPARGALRKAAWGTEDGWDREKDRYLYDGPPDVSRLTDDILRIANRGYAAYATVIGRLAGGGADRNARARDLTDRMRKPGSIQVAVHDKPRFLLPASLIYDYPSDTGLAPDDFTLCRAFLANLPIASQIDDPLGRAAYLAGTSCFLGACPNALEDDSVVCPGGLWGYRHSIGIPVSLESVQEWKAHGARPLKPSGNGDPPTRIDVEDKVEFGASISTDRGLTGWQIHEPRLRELSTRLGWHFANTRAGTFDMLKGASPHIVYFYCHGGIDHERPFIQVGPSDGRLIFGDNLLDKNVEWNRPRPLVFINGCHTTDVEPEIAHELVSAFVVTARASGVIGTEITVFEPLAREFAEIFFRAFLDGQPIGEAVRTARLALLARSNPLGLVYTAYAMSSLQLMGLKN